MSLTHILLSLSVLFLCLSVSVLVCVYLSVSLSLTQTQTHTREATGRTLFCNSYRIWSGTREACSVCVWADEGSRCVSECSQESMVANRLPGSPGTRPWARHCLIMAVISLTFPHNPLKTCGNSIFPFSFSYLENIAMSVFTSCVLISGLG